MKFTFALIGASAALASAFTPGRHLHFPRGNGTATTDSVSLEATAADLPSVTTLTVQSTRTSTIISCAATITDCPAGKPEMSTIPESDRETKTITETVDLTTTVCPVTDVASISQQIIDKYDSVSATSVPVSSVSATPSQTVQHIVKTTDIVSTQTVTLTIGTGERQSIVPTVLTTTIKSTITVPVTPAETGSDGVETTTTTTATSTTTKTITVVRAKSTNSVEATGNKAVSSDCVGPTVTVTVAQTTVTAPASTVYVTAPCEASQTAVSNKNVDKNPSGNDKTGSDNDNTDGDKTANNATTQCPADATATPCPTDTTTTIEAIITVVPFPANNGTTTTGGASPSGFVSLRR